MVTAAQWIVSGAGGVVIAALARFCFRARPAALAAAHDGVQEVRVRVKGGYSPDVIRAAVVSRCGFVDFAHTSTHQPTHQDPHDQDPATPKAPAPAPDHTTQPPKKLPDQDTQVQLQALIGIAQILDEPDVRRKSGGSPAPTI